MSETKEVFRTVGLPASATLDWINDRLAILEETIGPLVEMKLDNAESSFKFDALTDPPKVFAKIARQVGGKPDIPAGAKLVASGRIFIEGDQVLCAATRGP